MRVLLTGVSMVRVDTRRIQGKPWRTAYSQRVRQGPHSVKTREQHGDTETACEVCRAVGRQEKSAPVAMQIKIDLSDILNYGGVLCLCSMN